jgi:hypothetical protein
MTTEGGAGSFPCNWGAAHSNDSYSIYIYIKSCFIWLVMSYNCFHISVDFSGLLFPSVLS